MGDIIGHRLVAPEDDEEVSYDWTLELEEDLIASSDWAIVPNDSPSPLLDDASMDEGTLTSVTVSGLTFGVVYQLTNTVVTEAGRNLSQSFTLRCDHR